MGRTFTEREFLAFLSRTPEAIQKAEEHGLKDGADVLVAEAKDEIGTYQRENMGRFPDWEELAPATKADRIREGFSENEPGLRTGEMRAQYAASVSARAITLGNPDPVAKWFEEGTERQPSRPVIVVALFRKAPTITESIARRVATALARGEV